MAKVNGLQKILSIRVTPEKYQTLVDTSKATGESIAELCRCALEGLTVKQLPTTKMVEALREVSAQGNNLNQLARHANELQKAGKLDKSEYLSILDELKEYKRLLLQLNDEVSL